MLSGLAAAVVLCLFGAQSAAQAFTIDSISLATNGTRQVAITTDTDSYFCLLRGDIPATLTDVVSLVLGDGSLKHFEDASTQVATSFYRVRQVPKASSLDLDGDGMPDVFELTYGLNPLDASDASADPDHDGFTNLREYQMGTNPNVSNFLSGGGGLVINEIDYDNVGTDTAEFVEILNTGTDPVDLTYVSLVFFNGASGPATEYLRVGLSSAAVLYPGQYLVVCSTNVTVPAWALRVDLPTSLNVIQNGAPDGVALVNILAPQVLDTLSYEGPITVAQVLGIPTPINLVEETVLPAVIADSNTEPGSLIRWPNGTDSNDAATDWRFTQTPTPGAPNVPSFLSAGGGLVI